MKIGANANEFNLFGYLKESMGWYLIMEISN